MPTPRKYPIRYCEICGKQVSTPHTRLCRECFNESRRLLSEKKRCSKRGDCVNPLGSYLPATTEYFYARKASWDGLSSLCKVCSWAVQKEYEQKNRERRLATRRDWYKRNREKVSDKHRIYYRSNAERIKQKSREYRISNRETVLAKKLKWQSENPERRRNINARYVESGKQAIVGRRRRARVRNLPYAFTIIHWQRALDYFNGCCAVCGRPLRDLFGSHTAAADHWIPLASPDCPGTIPTNIVPLCHGVGGCNTRKQDKDASKWLIEVFGKRRAREILSRIESYFAWIREQDRGE